jgi:hypothetical protein
MSDPKHDRTDFVRCMLFSKPPERVLPLNFVKSSTWLTVSTNDVPHACTVWMKDICEGVNPESANSSAAARI